MRLLCVFCFLFFRQSIVPKFWQHFVTFEAQKNGKEEDAGEGSVEVMSRVATAVSELYDSAGSFVPQINR